MLLIPGCQGPISWPIYTWAHESMKGPGFHGLPPSTCIVFSPYQYPPPPSPLRPLSRMSPLKPPQLRQLLLLRKLSSSSSSSSSGASSHPRHFLHGCQSHHPVHVTPSFPPFTNVTFLRPLSFAGDSCPDEIATSISAELSQAQLADAQIPVVQRLSLNFSHVTPNPDLVFNTLNVSPDAGRAVLGFLEWLRLNPSFAHSDETISYTIASKLTNAEVQRRVYSPSFDGGVEHGAATAKLFILLQYWWDNLL